MWKVEPVLGHQSASSDLDGRSQDVPIPLIAGHAHDQRFVTGGSADGLGIEHGGEHDCGYLMLSELLLSSRAACCSARRHCW